VTPSKHSSCSLIVKKSHRMGGDRSGMRDFKDARNNSMQEPWISRMCKNTSSGGISYLITSRDENFERAVPS
jgi:hypothetical protein